MPLLGCSNLNTKGGMCTMIVSLCWYVPIVEFVETWGQAILGPGVSNRRQRHGASTSLPMAASADLHDSALTASSAKGGDSGI